jgi:hypothetical protein
MVYCVRAMRPTVAGSHPGRDLDTFPDRLAYRFTVRALEEAERLSRRRTTPLREPGRRRRRPGGLMAAGIRMLAAGS